MRNFFYGFLIILTAILVTKTGASGKANTTPAPKTGSCTAVAQTPVRSSTEIVSDGRFSCGLLGVDDVWMTVAMQKKAGNAWTTVTSAAFHGLGSATSSATSSTSRTRGVHAVCATGTFRTAVKVAGGSTKATDYLSGTVTDPCT
jgi:hypothetical protein